MDLFVNLRYPLSALSALINADKCFHREKRHQETYLIFKRPMIGTSGYDIHSFKENAGVICCPQDGSRKSANWRIRRSFGFISGFLIIVSFHRPANVPFIADDCFTTKAYSGHHGLLRRCGVEGLFAASSLRKRRLYHLTLRHRTVSPWTLPWGSPLTE